MMRKGHIISHRRTDFMGGVEQITHELKGGPLVLISLDLLYDIGLMESGQVPEIVTCFKPYKLIFIEKHLQMNYVEYLVIKNPLYYIYPLFRKLCNLLDLFYRRCIITLAVWQLAEYSEATVPGWYDIKIIIKIRDWMKARKDV